MFKSGRLLRGLNWGNFCLFISISTGGLNTRWLSHTWTSWWNHHWPHVQSAGYNLYTFRNKTKQVTRVWKWQVVWLVCWAAWWILWRGGLTLGHTERVGWWSRNYSETNDKIQYTSKENGEGAVLDSPLKGKTTETCVAESMMSICPACFKDRLSHWSFDPLLDVTE